MIFDLSNCNVNKFHIRNYVKNIHILQLDIDDCSYFIHNGGMDEQTLRRTPKQERSQQRVEKILEAASELMVTEGYEGLSTSAIAGRAGISVGSLYQFFANKEAVLQALAQRYLEKVSLLNETVFTPDAIYVPVEVLFDRTVETLVGFMLRNQGFHQLFNSPWISPELQAVAEAATAQMIVEIKKIFLGKAPQLADEQAQAAAEVLVHMVSGVLSAVETAVPPQRDLVIAEFKRMGIAYINAVIEE